MPGEPRNRYKDTAVFDGPRGPQYAPFQPPEELTPPPNVQRRALRATSGHVGFLDTVSVRYYGDGMEDFWWLVAWDNGMIDPERETAPGRVLTVPPRDGVVSFLSRAGTA